jgi:hypothetical protein
MYASALSSFTHSNSKCDTLINLKRQSAFLQIAFSVNLGVAYEYITNINNYH